MNNRSRFVLLFIITLFINPTLSKSQNFLGGEVHGSFQLDAQTYKADSAIGAPDVEEKMLMNGFLNVIYTNGPFTAGVRYEGYLDPILGYDPRYKGQGIPYRYVQFQKGMFDLTAGNFYEQFGNGLVLRSYEEWNLGYDNSIDGFRAKIEPVQGIIVKGVIGKQRFFWDKGPGIVRGADGEINFNDVIRKWADARTRIILGGSFVSKYQADEQIMVDESHMLNLPLDVGAWAGRLNLIRGGFTLTGEYAMKYNDPSAINHYIYKNGQAIWLNASYSVKGFGITLSSKYIDNMSFKSKRTETSNALDINFLPPLTDQYAYSLAAIYPYATQPNGEFGYLGQVVYTIPKKTKIGGKYGTTVKLAYSRTDDIQRTALNDTTAIGSPGTDGYKASLFGRGDTKYYEELNVELTRKFSPSFKAILFYLYQVYNIEVIEGHTGEPIVYAHTAVADLVYRLNDKHALHMELQHLWSKQDKGDWAMGLLEYTISPHWFFVVFDQYNYGNPDKDKRFHFYNLGFGYMHESSRIELRYARQREGIICVGGVCRNVPASNGFTLTITSSF
ncbi:MAG TPA: DUF6029 family protein [Bacteroidales bacterium]|nr:DUF6029 family protein [Bacteroidales bacterium]